LSKNVLRIGDVEISFLAEKDLPDSAKSLDNPETSEPTSPTNVASPSKSGPASSSPKKTTATPAASSTSNPISPQVQQLMDLGATRDQAQGALDAAGGNVDMAAGFIFGV
jgi:DNA damage-inducible protein 1